MFFAKGEINMNNIYKVIWSKAKNCYVVASEIAKSHTKSASGSEKMGGYGKKALLALAAAAAIFCGGLVNVGAVDTVHVDESGTTLTAHEVYTKDAVDTTFATKTEVNAKADNTTVTEQGTKITQLETAVGNTYTKAEAEGKFATSDALNTAKTDLDGKITANTAKITANETAITNLNNKAATTDTTLTNLSGRMTTAESDIGTLKADMTTAKSDIGTLTADVSTAKSDINTLKAKDTELTGKIEAEIANRITSDTALDHKIDTEIQDRKDAIKDTNDRTGGIKRNTEKTQTTIEGIVKVDNQGNVKDVKGLAAETITTSGNADLKGNVILGTNTANTVTVNGNADFNEAVNMDKGLTVTSGDTTLKGTKVDGKLTVTDETDLKNTKVDGTLTTTGKATFQEAVEMDKGLTVTSGDTTLKGTKVDGKLTVTDEADLKNTKVDGTLGVTGATTLSGELTAEKNATFEKDVTVKGTTNLKDTTVDGDLKVTGTITTDKMIFGDKATNNYTEIDHGKVTSKNLVVNGAGETISSSSTFNAKENKVGFANSATGEQSSHKQTSDMIVDNVKNNITGDQSFHKQTSDVIMDNVKDLHNSNNRTQTKTETKDIITDKDGNSSTTSQTASENKTYLKDKDGKNTNSTIDTAKGYDKTIKGENGETSTKQDELNITNTAQNGTITNDAMNIVNNASGNMTNTVGGDLTTTVRGNELHEVTGTKTENVTGKVTENYKAGQETNVTGDQDIYVTGKQTNKIDGDQVNIIGGNQTTTVTGDISNKAENITNEANTKLTDKVDDNTRVLDSEGITDTVPGADGKGSTFKQRIDAIMGNVKTDAGESEVTQKGDEITSKVGLGEATNSRVTQKKDLLEAAVTDGTNYNISNDTANESAKELRGGTKVNRQYDNLNGSQKTITNGTYTTSKLQTALDITNTAEYGTITNDAKNIVNNATGDMTNTVGGKLTTTVTGQATENFKGGLKTDITGEEIHTVTGNQTNKVTGKQTNTVEGGQENIISGGQTNTITGGQINNITGDQTTTITGNKTETVTENVTEDYKKNLTTTVGGNEIHVVKGTKTETVEGKVTENFKGGQETNVTGNQDIHVTGKQTNKIDGNQENTIGGDQTTNVTGDILNTAKNITNTANEKLTDEVGDNTRVTTSTSITDSVGATTNRKIEDGKITDTAGDSTVTTENGKGTTFAKTDSAEYSTEAGAPKDTNIAGNLITTGRVDANELGVSDTDGNNKADLLVKAGEGVKASASDGNTTGSLDVKADGITTSITNGTDHNTVSSTLAGGTIFTNSEAAAPVTGASGAGTAVNTTIKGNTITTGKVTMDYAEVMKDLGVHGNANITGKTTTGSLEVTGTSTLKGNVTMESDATVKKNLTVNGITTTKTLKVTENAEIDGNATIAGDVTANSYKVGDKTYIDANGIHANDQKITNVADGSISEGSKDAVNGGQLYGVKRDLEHQVDKVGANAAAMANLRPMEFDPSSKWNIAAAIGNYGSETAAALGAFYRPNDDVMVNLSTAFGTGENMVGGGVSVRLGKSGNKLSREENNALKAQVDDLTARMDALLSVLNPNMSKDFPDVPENHWAYEAVSRLAGNDIVQGYPDGEFHGERTMTRYEMAEIIYNALSRGAEAERELVEEFKPELQAMAASEKATAEKAEG